MTGMEKVTRDPQEDTASDHLLSPVVRRPLYQQVNDRITQLISEGVMKVGDQLPSERALSESLGVSRHSLRQALAALQSRGLIEIRHGSGAYLVEREPGQLASNMAEALIDSTENLPYVMESRFAVEPFITGLAAERGTAADVRAIRAALKMMEREIADGASGEQGDIAFHTAVLAAAHNPTLTDFMTRLQPDMARLREEALAQPTTPQLALDAHHAILDAIEAGDRERAIRAAHDHLVDAAEAILVSEFGTPSHTFLAEMLVNATSSQDTNSTSGSVVEMRGFAPAVLAATLSPTLYVGETVKSVQQTTGLDTVYKLDSTENPHGCSPLVSEALTVAAQNTAAQSDPEASTLRAAISRQLQVNGDQLVIGNGSDEVLQLIARAFLAPGRSAAACEPTYSQYRAHTFAAGASFSSVESEAGRTDPVALAAAASRASLLWVCNPNSPTGSYLSSMDLRRLMSRIPHNVVVVLDEAFAEYATASDFPDSVALIKEFPNLIVTRTFSTIHGLAGLRIGYAVASSRVANLINMLRSPFNTSSLAQAAALASIQDTDFIRQSREKNAQQRDVIECFLREREIDFLESQANFVLFTAPGGAESAYESLKQQGVLLKPGAPLGYPAMLRISVGTEEQVASALASLDSLI